MLQESNELTATERLFEIELELARISAWIDRACLPLEEPDRDPEEIMAEQATELIIQTGNIDEVIRALDQLRLDLLDGTQETI